jgi:hypothetical protein
VSDFGAALARMRDGQCVQRQTWMPKGISLSLRQPDDEISLPFVLLRRSDGSTAPWLACHNDLLAEDWQDWQEGL